MKKEAEIKLIEQIGELLEKLAKADSYFADELKHTGFDKKDIYQMLSNIKHDFSLTHGTDFRMKIENAITIYKQRCNYLAKMVRAQSFSIKTYENSINDLESEITSLRQFKQRSCKILLLMQAEEPGYQKQELTDALVKLYPEDQIISTKIEEEIPLNKEEKEKVKTALNYR